MKSWQVKIIYLGIFTGLLGDGKVLSSPAKTETDYPDQFQGLPILNKAGLPMKYGWAFKSNLSALQVAVNSDRQPNPANSPIPNLESKALEQQAQQLYEAGRYAEARRMLQQIAADRAAKGDELGQAMALRNLSLVYQKTGEWSEAKQAIADSLNLLQKSESSRQRTRLLALTLESQGQLQLSLGQPEIALDTWKQAGATYKEIGETTGVTRSRLNQVQALQALALYTQAVKTLKEIKNTLQDEPDSLLKAGALQSLGDALRVVGDLNQSREILQQSLAIAEKLQARQEIAAILLSSGNTARAQHKPEEAVDLYQRSLKEFPSINTKIEAQLNLLSLLVDEQKWTNAQLLVPQIQSSLSNLPPSRTAVYARINLAHSLLKYQAGNSNSKNFQTSDLKLEISQLLATAVQQARSTGDKRAESYALGNLGGLYEQNQQWGDARELTEKALLLAQAISAADIAYQWQWQLGRILNVQGQRKGAIASYNSAVSTLQSLRSDLVAISSDVQFSFRENVEPVYRELVGLLLQPGTNITQFDLVQARTVIESLQLAELDNFFRDACLDSKPAQIDQIDPTAAVFYTIILKDRLEVIVALRGKPLRHHSIPLPQEEVEAEIGNMREAITTPRLRFAIQRFLSPSQKVYDWLIRPVEADLAASGVQTLVFVLDGSLRNLPLASLHDGKQYLAEKYSVAIAPGLQLLDPQPLARQQLKVLTAGLTEAVQGFSALPNVELELQRIKAEAPTEVLLNQSFTKSNFQATVNGSSFPVVHLATHGEFSSEAKDTFILTWDGRINANELDKLLRSDTGKTRSIELLVLSACKTAAGDKRAALGLAGVAVRAGARSTLASLWYVSDEATSLLMTRFYEELAKGNVGKSEALRRAQLAVLRDNKFSHPYYWSAFVLVGNWL
jgi:CHAT domain-containing protein/tetratricopeptide (TPR) repeat protein